MRIVTGIVILILFTFIPLSGQTVYTGFIDKYPIELVTYIYSDGDARAIYAYTKYNTPMLINGRLEKNKDLRLFEKNKDDSDRALFLFKGFDKESNTITGTWKDLTTEKELTVSLTKKFDLDSGDNVEWHERELLQLKSIGKKYFRLVVSKDKENFYPVVRGVKVYEKSSNKLLQKIDVQCQLWGLDNIQVDDYNFDGHMDFSIFEASYAGPNTTSLYYLYDPKSESFLESGFSGVSLSFDAENKLIYEHNQCCAGRSHMNSTYKVVDNEMVLIERSCIEYDEEKEDFVKVDCD